MPAPTITPLPSPPLRTASPGTFSTDAEAFVAALVDFGLDLNAFAAYFNSLALTGVSGPIVDTDLTMAAAKLLGRTTAGAGVVEEISIGAGLSLAAGELAATGGYTDEQAQDAVGAMIDSSLSYDDAAPRLKVAQYIFSFFFTAVPSASEVLALHVAGAAFTIPGNFSAAIQASVGTNPTSSFALDVQKNGSTIGTITVSTGGVVTATTTSGTAKSFAAGDVVKIVAPGSADATAANMAFTLIGAR